ncbi:low affinity sulfate transporter 3-like [Phoenix dactylifera]|uniref:Low affinity sulfate transporter 3-like n=1 Tax=Phoenix dactylifera TaxID=42345 RepID=A0A8B7CYJ2_PHODC|nr:low affinity sulfate transporter 3-like [Phoenix dactylifera]
MGSSASESRSAAENVVEESNPPEIVISVLNTPAPPPLWHELTWPIREGIFPCRKESSSLFRHVISVLCGLFPVLSWGKRYDGKTFRSDLMAGLTLASLGIPQSIGYASLAKLDPQYGLYTSVIPPLIYAVMGSSRELAIGPVAVVSLLLSSMLQKLADPRVDPESYRKLVFTSTFFAGIFQAAFGLFRLGFLVDFLSHAATVGFMGGAAIVISLQQLKGLLGIAHFTTKTDVVSVMEAVQNAIHQPWHPENVYLGCSFLIFLLITRFIGRRIKKLFWLPAIAPLISVILSTLLVFMTRADKHGVITIQHIKGGLNPSSAKLLQFTGQNVAPCAKVGLICAIIALTEAMAVGRSFASIKGYHLDGNKEMVAMGFMNIAGSLSSCYIATGSFSRTAVNCSAGCKTAVSNIVMAITVFAALELLTRLLYYTPVAILASIILSSLLGLIDIGEAYAIWEVDKVDFLTCLGAFIGVLFGSVEIGLLIAVAISFSRIIWNLIRPQVDILGRIQGTDIFCSIKQYPMAKQASGLLILRIDSSFLYFVNANMIKERIAKWVKEEQDEIEENPKERIKSVVIDMSNVKNIDTTGIAALEELHKKLDSLGIQLVMANPGWLVIHKMKLASLVDMIGEKWIFLTVGEAVEACPNAKRDNGNG